MTTDYVLDETITLLGARGHRPLIAPFLASVLDSSACQVQWMNAARFADAATVLKRHADKAWSFTDCCSFVVMNELKLSRALTTAKHFEQAGFTALLR